MELTLIHSTIGHDETAHLSHDPLMDLLNEFNDVSNDWVEPLELSEFSELSSKLDLDEPIEMIHQAINDQIALARTNLAKLSFYLKESQDSFLS